MAWQVEKTLKEVEKHCKPEKMCIFEAGSKGMVRKKVQLVVSKRLNSSRVRRLGGSLTKNRKKYELSLKDCSLSELSQRWCGAWRTKQELILFQRSLAARRCPFHRFSLLSNISWNLTVSSLFKFYLPAHFIVWITHAITCNIVSYAHKQVRQRWTSCSEMQVIQKCNVYSFPMLKYT